MADYTGVFERVEQKYPLVFFHIGADRSGEKELSITIPESLDYTEVFDDFFKEYTTHAELTEVKTASLGSLYSCTIACALRTTATKKNFSMRFAAATAISKCAAASRILPWNSCKERSLPL